MPNRWTESREELDDEPAAPASLRLRALRVCLAATPLLVLVLLLSRASG